jgi:hypothetical protein
MVLCKKIVSQAGYLCSDQFFVVTKTNIKMKSKLLNPKTISLILSAIFILSACKKNDDEDPTANLIGTWNTSSSNFSAKVGDQPMVQYFVTVMGRTQTDAQLTTNLFYLMLQQAFTGSVTYKADNTYTATLGGDNTTGTWSLSADAKKLTIDPANDPAFVFDVVQLSSTTMQLKTQDTFSDDINEDNVPEVITTDVDLTFTKQ